MAPAFSEEVPKRVAVSGRMLVHLEAVNDLLHPRLWESKTRVSNLGPASPVNHLRAQSFYPTFRFLCPFLHSEPKDSPPLLLPQLTIAVTQSQALESD